MKVAYILNSTLSLGGASKAFKTLVAGLTKQNISVCVILPEKKDLYYEIRNMGLPVFTTTFRNNTYPYLRTFKDFVMFLPRLLGRFFSNKIAIGKITKWLAEQNVDIIHSNVGVVNVGYFAACKLNIPHVYHIREYGDLDFGMHYFPTKNAFYTQLNKPNSYSICITRNIQQYHKQDKKQTSRVIYDGICAEKKQMPWVKKEPFFLFAGRIESAKGLDFLLDAYAGYIKTSDIIIPLHIAGEATNNKYLATINKKINDYQIGNHVVFLGMRHDIEQIMQKATAIIIASPSEGFGLCMTEAMFNGCLVIGRNTSGTKEQMDNGYNITKQEIALRYNTKGELSEHLVTVSHMSESDMHKYAERAFNVVNSLYTKEATANQVTAFYNEILK